MAGNNEHIQEVGLKFTADGAAEYVRSLKDINAEMSQSYAEYQRQTAMLSENATATEKLTAKKEYLSEQVSLQKEKVTALNAELEAMSRNENANEAAIAKKRKELTQAEAKLANYEKGLSACTDELKNHSEWTDKVSTGLKDFGDKAEKTGKSLSVVTAAVTAVGAASYAAWQEVDNGLDTIIKKTGASGEALESLNTSFYNVYGSIPTTAEKAGVAIGEVNTRFGVTGQELGDLSRLFIQFAEINDTDLNGSIDNTSKIMTQWGLSMEDAANLLGVITNEAQRTGISTDTLMASLIANGATFKEMGLSVDQAATLLANFEINGVDAATALASLKKAALNYAADGKTMTEGLSDTIDAIKNAKDETEALDIATAAFGSKGALEMTTAIGEGRLSVDDLAQSMENMGTVVSDTFESTLDAPDKMTVAMNNLKIAGADLASSLMDVLTPILEKLVGVVQSVVQWFTSLDEGQKQTIVTIAAVVAAIGPALIILGKLSSSVGSIIALVPKITSGFSTISKAFTGFTSLIAAHPVIAAITAVIAIIVTLWNKCEWFRNLVYALWDGIKATFQALVSWLQTAFEAIKNALSKLWEGIKGIVDKIVDVFKAWVEYVKSVFVAGWTAAIEIVKGVFSSLFESLSAIWEDIKGIFNGIIDFVRNVFAGNWEGAWNSIVSVFGHIFSGIANFVKAPINAVISLLNGAIEGINKISVKVPDWIPGLGGKTFGFNIPLIPMLAKGGELLSGMAVVAEAGPELLSNSGGVTRVTPLTGNSSNSAKIGLTDETITRLVSVFLRALREADLLKVNLSIDDREFARLVRDIL